MSNDGVFLDFSTRKLRELFARIEICVGQLSEEQVWLRGRETENAVGNLLAHLAGNVRQWIVSSVGGRAFERQRDAEFAARGGVGKAEMLERLRAAVEEALAVIESLSAAQLAERRVVQGYDVSVLEAIYHVVEHFSMHTGQIILLTKQFTGGDLGFYSHLEAEGKHGKATP